MASLPLVMHLKRERRTVLIDSSVKMMTEASLTWLSNLTEDPPKNFMVIFYIFFISQLMPSSSKLSGSSIYEMMELLK